MMRRDIHRPGWPELIAGAVAFGILLVVIVVALRAFPDNQPIAAGLTAFAFSALLGLGAFAAAVLLRIRRLEPFGVRRTSARWIFAGLGLGVVAFALSLGVSIAYVTFSGDSQNVQGDYQSAAAGGVLAYLATIVLGSIATPIGEEFFWRGVVANFLGRYGAWVSVLGSAALFAVAHGINPVLPVAFVVGVITALLFRRTGSVWPGVAVHAVNNALSATLPLVVAAMLGS